MEKQALDTTSVFCCERFCKQIDVMSFGKSHLRSLPLVVPYLFDNLHVKLL